MNALFPSYDDDGTGTPRAGSARRWLHAAAFALSLATVVAAGLVFGVREARHWLTFAPAAVVAAQIAVLCGWPLLSRCRSTAGAFAIGLGMTALVYASIGPLISVMAALFGHTPGNEFSLDPLREMLVVSIGVAVLTIWVTLPVTVTAVVHAHGRLLRERDRD